MVNSLVITSQVFGTSLANEKVLILNSFINIRAGNNLLRRTTFRSSLRAASIGLLALLAGCGSGGPAPTAADQGTTNVVATTPAPTPAPPPPPGPSTAGLIAAVADNFDLQLGLEAAARNPTPLSVDHQSGFRFMCTAGQVLRDDPIVYPGQPGKSHLHQFYGNTGANAASTYESLRTSGGSTCDNRSSPGTAVNRTAYWFPAMLDGAGHVVVPDFVNVYYKQIPHGDPACQGPPDSTHLGWCVDLPAGLRFVFGYNMATMSGGPTDPNQADFLWFNGWDDLVGTPNAQTGSKNYQTMAALVAAGLPSGSVLVMQAMIPPCWDGKNLDSPDHRSHLAYTTGDYIPSVGMRACPADHPYLLPSAQFRVHFTTDANFTAGKWHLASDEMMPGVPAGTTLHFDYFEAWSPAAKELWFRNCIDKHLTCAEGELGNGQKMREAGVPQPNGWTRHQLIPVP